MRMRSIGLLGILGVVAGCSDVGDAPEVATSAERLWLP
jgi:hypothetical protein